MADSCLCGWTSAVEFFSRGVDLYASEWPALLWLLAIRSSSSPAAPLLAALSAPPGLVTAEGSKRQRRPSHKLGQTPLSDTCSSDTVPAKTCPPFTRLFPCRGWRAGRRLRAPLLRGQLLPPSLDAGQSAPQCRSKQEYGFVPPSLTKRVRKGIMLISELQELHMVFYHACGEKL